MTGPQSALCRRAAHHVATLDAGLPEYASDLRPVRGKCRKRRCRSRWAVVRVSLDFRDPERIDRFATTECAACGTVWRRVREPAITSRGGYQAVRLTLILPATVKRWRNHGAWHREGDDGLVLRDANIGDLDEAARGHRARSDKAADRRAADRAKRAADEAESHIRTADLLARLAAMDAERAAAEEEAADRA